MGELDRAKHVVGRRLLVRGESMVASTGLALAAILLLAMGAAGWWTLVSQRAALRAERESSLNAIGDLLAQSAERLLAAGDVSGVRTLVANTALEKNLTTCRLVLAGGHVVADADPKNLTDPTGHMPEVSGAGGVPAIQASEGDVVSVQIPLSVRGTSDGAIELSASVGSPWSASWKTQTGICVIGVTSLIALLLVYRRMRARLHGLGAIREALIAMSTGESTHAALTVNGAFGPEAQAWNGLLGEREKLRQELMSSRSLDSTQSRRDGKGDLTQACDALWQGLVLVDDQLKVKYVNGAAAVFLRSKREAVATGVITDFVKDAKVLELIRSVVGGTIKTRVTLEVKRPEAEGGGVLRFSVRPVRRDDTAAAIVMIEDVTQQRIADEARNSFVAHATHELRTPLTNIRLYVEQAVEDGENDPTLRATCLNVINQETRRLERIVGDMLSVAEIEAGSLQLRRGDVSLEAIFQDLKVDFEATAEQKRLTLRFEMPPKFPQVDGDRDKIVLALHNLIGNAIKYTPEGGSVIVKVDTVDDKLVVEVADTGYGVAEDESELIFEKFYRSKDRRITSITGTGLGLALAREVIRMHGGDISLRSKLDQGSTFTLSLPARAAA